MWTDTCRDPPGLPAADAATRLPVWPFPPSRQAQFRPSTQPLAPLHEGDVVRVQSGSWATKARVLKPSTYPRSYHVITREGRCLRRNRKHLLPTGESFQQDSVPNRSNVEPSTSTAARHVEDTAPSNDPTTAGTQSSPTPAPRRSLRTQRPPPRRLEYDKEFEQIA
ncbi:hypothetical protein MRX96_009402 [Rhipicephalus microplus]